jgi:chromatin remodeling complex protein RSC6
MSKATKSKTHKLTSEKEYVKDTTPEVHEDTKVEKPSKSKSSKTVPRGESKNKKVVVQEVHEEVRYDVHDEVHDEVEHEEVHEDVHEEVQDETGTRRREVSKESLLASLDEVMNMIDEEVNKMRESSSKTNTKGVKFLRTLKKRLSTIKSDTSKVVKQKPLTKRKTNGNSGFLKPVKISSEMAKFTKWGSDDMKSRVDVTKYICNYIKEHNLQNPSDKRQILADDSLCKILSYDPKKDGTLTYPKMQGYLKRHFTKV